MKFIITKCYINLQYLPDHLLMIMTIVSDRIKPLYDDILYNLSILFSVANYATVTGDEMKIWLLHTRLVVDLLFERQRNREKIIIGVSRCLDRWRLKRLHSFILRRRLNRSAYIPKNNHLLLLLHSFFVTKSTTLLSYLRNYFWTDLSITFICFDTNNNNVNLNIYGLISILNEETIYQEYLQAEITDENIDVIVWQWLLIKHLAFLSFFPLYAVKQKKRNMETKTQRETFVIRIYFFYDKNDQSDYIQKSNS